MSSPSIKQSCDQAELVSAYALRALSAHEVPGVEAHIAACPDCREELETLRPIVDSFITWPTDVLRPMPSLWDRLVQRIADEDGGAPLAAASPQWSEPQWEQAGPGISCKLLSTDTQRDRVSMLVRLAPGAEYPPHSHAGVEELYLLDGELCIDSKTLYPGDYNRAEPGTADDRVWSETGCTCVLITSPADQLR
jgi:anti-sigma factor ChrR (cupin superfamily)